MDTVNLMIGFKDVDFYEGTWLSEGIDFVLEEFVLFIWPAFLNYLDYEQKLSISTTTKCLNKKHLKKKKKMKF